MTPAAVASISFLTGAIAGIVSILGLWAAVYLFSRSFEPDMKPPVPFRVLILALILKVPALIAGWLFTRSLGTAGPAAFCLGIVLVYSLAVVRIALRSERN